ncbi:MAG: hypothetical protein Q8O98_02265 [bacterium]|nr:hypothetical protein [bacterium]
MQLDNLHHAYLVLGEPTRTLLTLVRELEELGLRTHGNPDFFIHESEKFGVEEARELALMASVKAFTERKVYIIKSQRLSSAAQNALLKTFEEPPASTHFFLLAREAEGLLPTLRSRMMVIERNDRELDNRDAQAFLALPVKQRLNFAKEFADEGKDLPSFLDSIQGILRAQSDKLIGLRVVYDLRFFANDPSASARLMLEYLALVL